MMAKNLVPMTLWGQDPETAGLNCSTIHLPPEILVQMTDQT